jgi:hypothetical protein
MRKIILAAAIATSALGLAACGNEAETETDETVEAMTTDADAADNAGEEIEATVTEGAADVEAAAEGAADNAVKTADEIGDDALDVVDKAEDAGAE